MGVVPWIIIVLLILYLLAVRPGRGRAERMEVFERNLIAHRGLHDNHHGVPENSMAAFRRAAGAGYGIELDVQLTADGVPVVLHDSTLRRVAGVDRQIGELTCGELQDLCLFHTEERVPLLEEVLGEIHGLVPLIVELKCDGHRVKEICTSAVRLLDVYRGAYCIESFNPLVVRWFRKNRPEVLRGQLSERFTGHAYPKGFAAFLLSLCICNFLTKPDFIAYNWRHAGLLRFRVLRFLFHAETAAWTVKDEESLRRCREDFDIFICEGFLEGRSAQTVEKRPDSDGEKRMEPRIRKHLMVSGTVTGVGFRYRARYIAQSLGITGWVRNTWDDRVELEVQGPPRALDELLAELSRQRFIEIRAVEEEVLPVDIRESTFVIRH